MGACAIERVPMSMTSIIKFMDTAGITNILIGVL